MCLYVFFFCFFFPSSFLFFFLWKIYIYIRIDPTTRIDSYRSRMVTRFRMQIDSNFSFAPSSRFAINIYPWRKSVSLPFPSSVAPERDSNELNIIRYDGLLFFNERLRSPRLKTFSDFNRRKIFTINWTTTNRSITKNIFYLVFFSRGETLEAVPQLLDTSTSILSFTRFDKLLILLISLTFFVDVWSRIRFLEWLLLSNSKSN